MDIQEILDALTYNKHSFPEKALEAATENFEDIKPHLLAVLENDETAWQEILEAENDYCLHLFALYLLAQFREARAYPLITELVTLPSDTLNYLLGDAITEGLPRMFASVAHGDPARLYELIENPQVDVWVRGSAIDGLVTMINCGELARDTAASYFKELFTAKLEHDPEIDVVWSGLVGACCDIYPEEFYEDIKQCFEEDLMDPFLYDLADVEQVIKEGQDVAQERLKNNVHLRLIEDTAEELRHWAYFQPEKPKAKPKDSSPIIPSVQARQTVEQKKKIGRNEPCPCGSGRKYKHCCGSAKNK